MNRKMNLIIITTVIAVLHSLNLNKWTDDINSSAKILSISIIISAEEMPTESFLHIPAVFVSFPLYTAALLVSFYFHIHFALLSVFHIQLPSTVSICMNIPLLAG